MAGEVWVDVEEMYHHVWTRWWIQRIYDFNCQKKQLEIDYIGGVMGGNWF